MNSLTGNLQKFGLDRVPKVKTLDELLQDDETSDNPTQDCPETMNQPEHKSQQGSQPGARDWIDVESNTSQRYLHARWFDSDLTFC